MYKYLLGRLLTRGPFTYDVTAFFVIFDPLLPPCHYVSLFLNPPFIMTSFLDTPPPLNKILGYLISVYCVWIK